MDIILKVDPQVLLSKSNEITTEKNNIQKIMDQIKSDVTSLSGVHKGAAAEAYQNRFKQVYNDIEDMIANITEYIKDLNESAEIFQNVETAITNINEGLPTDAL